ncbi:TIGR03643 family protein [uncultured Umboniibacter sp.]|uniref:TIGR03643 family protein n=1 Tax=uncultured Umboniibacter sp. TaxID=1798917 RepID=UPI00260A2175|nr:TIGR03643 family protein [uncultured Umboniibacter sp.]
MNAEHPSSDSLSPALVSELVAMAWCDKTSFDDIELETGFSERQTIRLMRRHLKASSFKLWRKRVSGRVAKHRHLCS